MTVRLIKGAYWDYEVIHAEQMGWPVPVWTDKAGHRRLLRADGRAMFVEAMPRRAGEGGVKLALGSHNVRSIAHALALLEKHGLPPSAVEVQKLYGMADPLRQALVDQRAAGPRVRAGGRDDSRHGLSRPPAAGEHVEPIVAAGRFLGRSARRGAAGRRPHLDAGSGRAAAALAEH